MISLSSGARTVLVRICILAAVVTSSVFPIAAAQENDRRSGGGQVFVLPLKGGIDQSLMILFRRAFREVERAQPDAIVIDIDTPGGRLRETEEIIGWMRSLETPVYAYVNPRALSAGAIISLGSDRIFMAPGSRIGSALPIMMSPGGGVQSLPSDIQEKVLSDTRALVRGLAQENGHSEDVAIAMVDPDQEVKIGERVVCEKGQLLNLTAREAVEIIPPDKKPLLAEAVVDDVNALLEHVGLVDATIVRFEPEPAERLARFIVLVGPVLFSLGILGIFIELKTPGFGIPGIAGIVCLAIYFFGHYVAGLAGMEDIALVAIGLVLLGLEVFVIPGFGVAGILGILLIVAGTILGMIPYLPDSPSKLPDVNGTAIADYFQGALLRMLIMIGLSAVGIYVLSKLLPKTSIYNRLVLQTALSRDEGYTSGDAGQRELLGKEGVAATALRPAGIAMFDRERLDVVSSGEMIEKGARVRVIKVEGRRIVVEPVSS